VLEEDERRIAADADAIGEALLELPCLLVGDEAGPAQGAAGSQIGLISSRCGVSLSF
jgi:hypothetical protein